MHSPATMVGELTSGPKFSAGAERVRFQPWSANRPLGRLNRLLRRTDRRSTYKSTCAESNAHARIGGWLRSAMSRPSPGDALAGKLLALDPAHPSTVVVRHCPRTFACPDFAFRVVDLKVHLRRKSVERRRVNPASLLLVALRRRDGRRTIASHLSWRTIGQPRV